MNIPEYDNKIECSKFKMEYSKNLKQKKYVPGARKVEPGLGVQNKWG